MGRTAEHVYTDADAIARIEHLCTQLPNGARVRITLDDGSTCEAVVTELPIIQDFFDFEGNEGMNAVVRLEDPSRLQWTRYLWLDQIQQVELLISDDVSSEPEDSVAPPAPDRAAG